MSADGFYHETELFCCEIEPVRYGASETAYGLGMPREKLR
jgi:hypothetical protein